MPFAQAGVTTDILVKDLFEKGETLFLNYTIVSDTDIEVKFIPHIECESAPVALIREEKISLSRNVPYKDSYTDKIVDDLFEPEECLAYIRLLEPIQKKTEKNFRIKIDPSFNFRINLNKKVFVKNEEASIDFISEVQNLEIALSLIFPDKTRKQITLPYSFKPTQTGTYTVESTASKEGYKPKIIKEQFAVIEKEPDIKLIETCNADDGCDSPRENNQNCPQDCPPEKLPSSKEETAPKLPVLVFIAIGAFLIIGVYLIMRKRHAV